MQFFLISFSTLFSLHVIFSHHLTPVVTRGKIPDTYILGDVAINCGCYANYTALDGRHWVGETPLLQPQGESRISASKLLAADPIPYTTARVSSTSFYYTFRVNPGQIFIRLHFSPGPYQGFENSQDFFTVKANSFILLQNFSASLAADALGVKYFVKEFCLNVNETRSLQIRFFPSQRNSKASDIHAFVNGIEIIYMPTGLYYTPDGNLGPRVVDQGNHFYYVDNKTALELVYRLNVGGGSISPVDDTGMFRRWSEDADYLLQSGFQQINSFLPAVASINVPHFIVPLKIYQTSWKLRDNSQLKDKHYFTWKLPVDLGFGYILRLHLCSFEVESAEGIQEGFDILVQNIVAESKVNLIQLSGGYGIPVYRDYLVMMKGDKSEGKCDLFVSIHSVDELAVTVLKGLEIFKLSNPDNSLASPNPSCSNTASPFWTLKLQKFMVAFGKSNIIMTVLTIILAILNVAVYKLKQICKFTFWQEKDMQSAPDKPSCRHFSLAEILSATENFNDALVIGKGGFGKVYRGFLYGRPEILAIKRLKPDSKQGAHEFWREIETLSKLRHIHLVSLIGYCNESQEMILVYEYMPRGTVADNLYKAGKDGKEVIPLTWEQRLKICIGAARGLDYLHTGTEHGVIHRDVKDTNILLDENFVAKISDFGLSKLGRTEEILSQLSTKIKGTVGYLDPDYLMTHKPSTKSDIYAFGIVLLVVLSGRPAMEFKFFGETASLLACFRECMRKREMDDVIDPCLQGEISAESLTTFIEVVGNCLHRHPKKRPTMAQVVVHLEHALEKQEGLVPSILGGENVLSQTFADGSDQPFDFYELQVAPIPENSILSSLGRGNSSEEIEKADLVTNVEVSESREKDRNPIPIWGRPWVALRNIRKPAKKKELALRCGSIFSLKEIKSATQNFSNDFLICQGGYFEVYKGFIKGGSEVVAIKRWSSYTMQEAIYFDKGVQLLYKLQFIHLVSFLGCCTESKELILVYEYMSQGSLDTHLYGGTGNRKNITPLTWEQRLIICTGAARGLNYLHELGVLHRNFNDRCIMLDEQLVPKISGGLYKMFDSSQSESHVSTRVVGTIGYWDPDYLRSGELTKASDVYSFGMVLLVVLSGRPAFGLTLPEEQQYLKSWYETCFAEGNVVKIIDPTLIGKIPSASLRKFTELIEKCLLEDRKLRPSMAQVLADLEETLILAQTDIHVLLQKLANGNLEDQRAAAEELRWLTKRNADNRAFIVEAGGIPPLVVLLTSPDFRTQEHSVTTLLNLSISEDNKRAIVNAGAIPGIVEVLKNGNTEARENAAATLFSLSIFDENKVAIGAAGAIPPLVDLLSQGTQRGKTDAATAIFCLLIYQGNKARALRAGIVPPLVGLLKDPGVGLVDEALAILALLASHPEGKVAVSQSDPMPILVEVIRTGSPRIQENAAAILLSLCTGDLQFQRVARELGVEEELKKLSENGTDRAKRKAGTMLELLRGIEGGNS